MRASRTTTGLRIHGPGPGGRAEVAVCGWPPSWKAWRCASARTGRDQTARCSHHEAVEAGSHEETVKEKQALQARLHAELDLNRALTEEAAVVEAETGEPTEFCKYTLWDGTVFNTQTPGERLKFLQFRHNAITKGIESGTASGAFAPLLEKAVEYEATLALDVKEEEESEAARIEAEAKAAAKAAKKKKKQVRVCCTFVCLLLRKNRSLSPVAIHSPASAFSPHSPHEMNTEKVRSLHSGSIACPVLFWDVLEQERNTQLLLFFPHPFWLTFLEKRCWSQEEFQCGSIHLRVRSIPSMAQRLPSNARHCSPFRRWPVHGTMSFSKLQRSLNRAKLFTNFDERIHRPVDLFLRVRRRNLTANPRLAPGHNRVTEPYDKHPTLEHRISHI